ncbi:MAG: ribose-phosphate pyrophosphokinase [Armatimonadetes bacterium]|nr:ribose-phosphate pyrophosphokinase [Armatimonadota bacterium]
MDGITVFCGQGHPELAENICYHLNIPLSPTKFQRFSNDCQYIQLLDNCRERDVYIIQPIAPPVQDNLMELMLMLDAARGASARRRTAVIPHFAYARSDKKDAPRISIAARLVADLLVTAGTDRVLTVNLHSDQVHGFFSCPVDHLNALNVLASHFRGQDLSNTVVVSPDLGNAKSASHFARILDVPVAAGQKRRISDDKVVIDMIVGDVAGRECIVMDDEIATGTSVLELLACLRDRGATSFRLACTHGLLTRDAVAKLTDPEDVLELVITDTVPLAEDKRGPKVKVLTVSRMIAEAIRRIHAGESVSSLFDI